DVEAVFPQEYGQPDLAGKTAIFTIVLHDVKAFELPALDDEFAKSVSENQTVDELRADIRKRLEAIAESRGRRAVGNTIMEKLIESHDFPLPSSLVDREVDSMVNDTATQAQRAGVSLDEYLKDAGKSESGVREEYRKDAEARVKGTLLIEAVAKAEQIAATPADISDELAALASQYGQPVDRIRKALGNNVISLMDGIVRNKTLEFLIDNAKVSEKK
ncbi:MAG TPA: trigger factor, partial [Candidatus Baltobacteraceae bacterium]|nr:trigger factor [Candidatus Baltobacteraceae bacterium]